MKREFLGELVGTFIMVLFGCGAVAVSVLYNAHQGLFQIAMIWGIGVCLAIFAARHLSCAHFNPAVTLAMVVTGRMNPRKMLPYLAGQFSGSILAGLTLYGLFAPIIASFEKTNHIVRGTFDSVATAKMFGEYYHQPGSTFEVGMLQAMGAELLGTFLLVLIIFLLTDNCNLGKPDSSVAPLFIGLAVASNICLIAPLTQAGLNPARDFGPRLVALLFGWGKWAFPDQTGGFFFVYMLAPIIGGILAGLLFTKVFEPAMKIKKDCCK